MNVETTAKPKVRTYFYTENGIVKRYLYCTFCGGGPFKENDGKVQRFGSDKTPVNYCPLCFSNANIHKYSFGATKQATVTAYKKRSVKTKEIKTKEALAIDELINALDPDVDTEQTIVFIARGKDGLLFCTKSEDPDGMIDTINSGKIKQSGIGKTALPMQIVYRKVVGLTDCDDFVRKIRVLTKVKKNELISAYQKTL